MANGGTTLITPEMEAAKGQWGPERTSPPISASDIRKWAIATYWPQTPPPIYWDEAYAAGTRYGGVIAPCDFNPFAWPVRRPAPPAGAGAPAARADGAPRLTTMNGGQVDTYGAPMRPGDVVTTKSRLQDFNEREGRLGLTLYVFNETEWTNQKGEFVRRRISTAIRY
jgi:acyl dehydratase